MDPRELADKILEVLKDADYNTANTALSLAESMIGHEHRAKDAAWWKQKFPETVI